MWGLSESALLRLLVTADKNDTAHVYILKMVLSLFREKKLFYVLQKPFVFIKEPPFCAEKKHIKKL